MLRITDHGKRRLSERVGADSRDAAIRNAEKAYGKGIKHAETKSLLKRWMDRRYLLHRDVGMEMRLYRGYLYVFRRRKLITVFAMPDYFQEYLDIYMEKEAYRRYKKDFDRREMIKNSKDGKKYKEKKKQFDEKVLLYDLRSYSGEHFDVDITGFHMKDQVLYVHYIPKTRKVPNMNGLANYIKNCTEYKGVQLVHVKDKDGRKMYRE